MTIKEFISSTTLHEPPTGISVYAASLWFNKKGDWEKAHTLIQDLPDNKAAWIHAYLHRKEGDNWNADYWYNKAHKTRPNVDLNEEWNQLAAEFLIV